MRVYGWTGTRREAGTYHNQTREIVAARSMAEVGRIVGQPPRRLFNLTETANDDEVQTAMSEPGVVLWHPLDERPPVWRRDDRPRP